MCKSCLRNKNLPSIRPVSIVTVESESHLKFDSYDYSFQKNPEISRNIFPYQINSILFKYYW